MGQVYFVRHGQTIWNVENKICGATDIALTELGHKQAVETGKKILGTPYRRDYRDSGKGGSTFKRTELWKI